MQLEYVDRDGTSELTIGLAPAQSDLWQSLRNWWCVVPLIYFATNGNFLSPQAPPGWALASASETSLSGRLEQMGAWGLGLLLMFPFGGRILKACRQNGLITIMTAYTALSAIWSPEILDSLRRGLLLTLTVLFAYFLTERFDDEELMRLFYMTGCVVVLASLFLVVAAPGYGRMFDGEWKGIFSHKNEAGIFVCFLLSPRFFMKRDSTLSSLAGDFCGLLGLVLVAGTQSRSGWAIGLILIAYAVVGLLIAKFPRAEVVALSFSLVVACAAIGWLVIQNYSTLTYLVGKDPSLTNRSIIWGAVWDSILKRPLLGFGYGGFFNGPSSESMNVIAAASALITHAHNGYLNLTVQTGFLGLALFLVVSFAATKDAIVTFFARPSKAVLWYGSILLITVVGSADESFLMNYNAVSTIMFVVACVQLRKIASGEEAAT